MVHASLCTGIGACELAVTWMGWINAFSCEIDEFCNTILKYYYPNSKHYGNIFEQDFREWKGRIDVLTAGFPCFVAGTPVLTRKGFLPIEDIQVGDEVLTTDRTYHPVECTMKHEADEIIYLRAQGMFQELKCTPNHPFYVRKRKVYYQNRKKIIEFLPPEYVEAKDIKHLDKVGYIVHNGKDTSYTPEFWKMVGTFLADGWIRNGKRAGRKSSYEHKIIICCGEKNFHRLEKTIHDSGYNFTLSKEKTVYKAIICDKKLCEFMKQFGKYAHGKRLSPQCFILDNERKKALLEGWFCDGYTEKNGNIRVTTVSKELALGMAHIARDVYHCPVSVRKCNMKSTCTIEGRVVNQRNQYHVIISNSSRYGFYEDGFVWCNVKSIRKENEINTVYNLAVNEEHSYNVYGIAVHNCQPFSVAGARNGAEDDRYLWPEVLRVVNEVRPTWFIGENVGGITTMVLPGEEIKVGSYEDICGESYTMYEKRQRYVIEQIRIDLESIGYQVQPIIIPACAVGAPHRRDRVWFLASNCADTGVEGLQRKGEDCIYATGFTANTDDSRLQEKGTEQQTTRTAGSGEQRITPHATEQELQERFNDEGPENAEEAGARMDDRLERYGGKRTAPCPDSNGLQRCRIKGSDYQEGTESGNEQSAEFIFTGWENFPTQSPVCGRDARLPFNVHDLTIPYGQWREKSIKAYGNTMCVPVVYEIFKAIQEVEDTYGR